MTEKEKAREALQSSIDTSKTVGERRKYGQFSTRFLLAKEIMAYGLDLLKNEKITFLEPSLGTGVFYSAFLEVCGNKNVKYFTGIELDKSYYDAAKSLWEKNNVHILNKDFTRLVPDRKYNFIVANPPYVRHHYLLLEEKSYLSRQVAKETEISISGLSGLYCYFVLLTHKWLASDAVCGWLIPSEFMDVNYGKALKEYLLNKVHLIRIHRYDPENSKFDNALVSSCVVWFKNEIVSNDYDVEFSYGDTIQQPQKRKIVKKSVLVSESKWTRFPEKEIRVINSKKVTLGDYFTIKRGLATGDNNFFILEKDKIQSLGLDMTFFKPILPNPRNLKTDFVEIDNDGLPKIERQYYLLDCTLTEIEIKQKYPALWKYLNTGKDRTGNKSLCKSRKEWYWQERRTSTRFLCSYMGRGKKGSSPIRFILNLSDAIATNSYLMLYPNEKVQCAITKKPNLIFKIWDVLKNITANDIENEGRVYGGGLKKIEPRELANVNCPGLQAIIL